MDIDQIRAFCKLAEKEHYGVAAQALFMSQSALTKKIQRLEERIGARLFERGRAGAKLTTVGKTLLPEAQRLEENFNVFEMLSKNVSSGKSGLLKIGYGLSSHQLAPKCIASFKNKNPDIHISLDDMPSCKQLEMLLDGDIQISFNRIPVLYPLKSLHLGTDKLVIAIHTSITIENDKLFDIVNDLDYMRLNPARGPGLANQIEKYFCDIDLKLPIAREANDILTLLSMVSANLGYTIVPESAKLLSNDQIQYITLPNANTAWDIGVVWNESIQDPIRDNFVNFMRQLDINAKDKIG